jgi:hypothetical protein
VGPECQSLGPNHGPTAPGPRRPPSDSGHRRLLYAHDFATHRISHPLVPPPSATASCDYKGSALLTSSPFSTSVFRSRPSSVFSLCHADANRCTPVHRAPPPPATTLSDRRLLELHPALVHLCDPSSSSPDNPSGPSA